MRARIFPLVAGLLVFWFGVLAPAPIVLASIHFDLLVPTLDLGNITLTGPDAYYGFNYTGIAAQWEIKYRGGGGDTYPGIVSVAQGVAPTPPLTSSQLAFGFVAQQPPPTGYQAIGAAPINIYSNAVMQNQWQIIPVYLRLHLYGNMPPGTYTIPVVADAD